MEDGEQRYKDRPQSRFIRHAGHKSETAAASDAFYRCPGAHHLPHRGRHGECTPLYCGDERGDFGPRISKAKRVKKDIARVQERMEKRSDPLVDKIVAGEDDATKLSRKVARGTKAEEMGLMGRAAGRLAARLSALGTPWGLQGKAAEDWSDAKLLELLPIAVAETEYQLKFGDDPQRARAAEAVFSATGRKAKEGGGNSSPTIILVGHGAGGSLNFPWAMKASHAVVDAVKPDAQEQPRTPSRTEDPADAAGGTV